MDDCLIFQLETSFIADGQNLPKMAGGGNDLFSELHGNLSDQLQAAQMENEQLRNSRDQQLKQFGQILSPFFQRLGISGNNFGVNK
jgi:hypothetical protein